MSAIFGYIVGKSQFRLSKVSSMPISSTCRRKVALMWSYFITSGIKLKVIFTAIIN